MSFKYDLQLLYHQQDNSRKESEEMGWGENLLRFLRILLRQFLGREPVIFSGQTESGDNPDFSEIKTLVFIISPESINDPELLQYINDYKNECDREHTAGLAFAGRVFKVVKLPVSLSGQPENIRALLPYDLYDYDPASGKTREIINFFSQEAEMNYWMKLVDLAYDIHESLSRIDNRINTDRPGSTKKSVFLAETGPELIVQRNMIKRELLRQGYQVHPDRNLPDDPDSLTREVNTILGNCDYSIHLMGDHVVASSGISIAEVQNSAVSTFIKTKSDSDAEGFSRLIWLSPNFRVKEEREQAFLETMRRDLEDVGHTEIFQTPFEDFKFVLKNSMVDVGDFEFKIQSGSENTSGKNIYLIYDKTDRDGANALAGHIRSRGFNVLEPSFDGDLMDIRQLHIQNLIDFDAAMVYAGNVNSFWVKMKFLDILKSPGFGRIKSLDHKSIFIESPGKIDTGDFSNFEVSLLEKNEDGFGVVDTFINSLV